MVRTASIYRHQKERAQRAGQLLDYTLEEFRAWAREWIHHRACEYCGTSLTIKTLSTDHCRPIARGGSHSHHNLVFCCERCNQCKGILEDDEYLALLALLARWPAEARTNMLARLRAGAKVIRGR